LGELAEQANDYRKKSFKNFKWTGIMVGALAVLETMQWKFKAELFQSIAKQALETVGKIGAAADGLIRDAAHFADKSLYHVVYAVFLLFLFEGWHLLKDKPAEMADRIKEAKRHLEAKITIITKDEIDKARAK